ncbi:hypothetical protein K402DRAFT_333595 [Aulographum hederae CBS 113979]|uniref:SANT domain-containing protein n=1 Tax=Aulographum hederae CBS 113979 TaxID=1176131 RepID=A0A6G1GYY4_9PEZI|nr:hypothetical protein K402DRAFT_333595 [Aulographum hederae CBS 113979]
MGGAADDAEEDAEGDDAEPAPKRRKWEREATPKENETKTVDEEKVRMSELTKDIKIGQLGWAEMEMRKVNWKEVAMKKKLDKEIRRREIEADLAKARKQALQDSSDEEIEEEDNSADATRFPATRINEAGEIEVLDGSHAIDRERMADMSIENLEEVDHNDVTNLVNKHSYMNSRSRDPMKRAGAVARTKTWSEEETERFFEALSTYGTDFGMLADAMPGRTRDQVKRKFNTEDKKDSARVTRAMRDRTAPMNIERFEQAKGRTLPDPQIVYRKLKAKEAKKMVEILAAEEAKKERERQERVARGEEPAAEGDEAALENAAAAAGGKKEKRTRKRKEKERAAIRGGEEVEVLATIED